MCRYRRGSWCLCTSTPFTHLSFEWLLWIGVLTCKSICSLKAQFTTSAYLHTTSRYAFPKSPVNLAFSSSQFWGWHTSVQLSEMQSHLNPSLQLLCLSPLEQWEIKELRLRCLLWKVRCCGANSQEHFMPVFSSSDSSHCTSSVWWKST